MDSTVPTIRAVLFDADGVVQRTPPDWIDEVKRLCGDPRKVEAFIEDVFEAEAPCLLGEGDFAQSLSSVLQKWKSPVSLSHALNVWKMIEPDNDVLDLVGTIRSNDTCVALATNQQHHRAEFMLNELGYDEQFDEILCSCFIGHAKPSAAYFQKSIEMLGLPADELLFIDDHEKNVAAARAVGLYAERFHLEDGLDALRSMLARYGLQTQ